jgi:UDPglucose 6-dehydrogenase
MRIGIIGMGFVGSAIAFAHRHDDLVTRDPKLKDSAAISEFNNCDAVYICVPSPSTEDGHCDTSILESVLKELIFLFINKEIPIISKVTAPPSAYDRLIKQYPNLVYCPEFLTAANAMTDYQNADYFIFGGHKEWCEKAAEIVRHGVPMVHDKLLITDIKTASLYKYMMNSYLAMKVTFMNDFAELADAHEIDFKKLTELSVLDHRIGPTHMAVPGPDRQYGWGGFCFPKDIAAICREALDMRVPNDFNLLQQVETQNKKHRMKND